ncbi:TetR/AcrR family transcriptional regulator [Salinibacterium hongtaonis]|uniref:TetR/AcrR family transcriptional regulator n=1 Tax=Homoserinimonas hongtaonis TaxID=2079791 RepID=A0A2U1T376_9MICO|nr:TetR/AcrR family transcriptional regulator [Salinibacterium hongtaonis]AWB90562.1 TetR/AcrR family transcriptional regulator [Salinibacterium hongtaonis]PWB98341.1 TetR/AcrR family transcriptional regulator [Salinibacterium hongtaonis]
MEKPVDTEAAILESAVALLRERTFEDITYLDLAEAAAVSERTIYRRFPTRSHLLEALARWIESQQFPLPQIRTPEEFRAAVRERFRAYERAPGCAFVAARGASLSPTMESAPTPLARAVFAMLTTAAPTLNSRDTQRIAATAQYFASPIFWARMRTGFDMNADETFEAFDRAMSRAMAIVPQVSWAS